MVGEITFLADEMELANSFHFGKGVSDFTLCNEVSVNNQPCFSDIRSNIISRVKFYWNMLALLNEFWLLLTGNSQLLGNGLMLIGIFLLLSMILTSHLRLLSLDAYNLSIHENKCKLSEK